MHIAQDRNFWDRFSILLSHTANLQRDPKAKPYKPHDFNVYGEDGKLKRAKPTRGADFAKTLKAYFPNLKEGTTNDH